MGLLNFASRLMLSLLIAAAASAQQPPKQKELPDAPAAKMSAQQTPSGPLKSTIEILGKRSLFFPDLAASPGPLSAKEKFELFADESVAPWQFVSSAFGAGLGQAQNSLADYGQEMGGYGKRFGSSMASAASSSFFGTFLLSAALHDDPRYFPKIHGGPGRRIGYALSRTFVIRTDEGGRGVNWPRLIAPLLAESLATTYLPASEQTVGKTFQRTGWRIGLSTASNILKEYWPTIFRSLRLNKVAAGHASGLRSF